MSLETKDSKHKVQLYVYDISQGMAKMMSQGLLGKHIEAVYHTGLVVYGWEYYYGGGIQASRPGQTVAGQPMRIVDMGETALPQDAFHDFLRSVSHRFTPETYSLLSHNCNNFCNEASKFLLDKEIPSYITGLPEEALNTPMGQMFKPVILNMEANMKRNANMGSVVPWGEGGGSTLWLPPITNPSKKTGDSKATPPPNAQASQSQSQAQQQQPQPAAAVSKPATNAASTGHAHERLTLSQISAQNRPLLSQDSKQKSFEILIKTGSKKLDSKLALSDADIATLSSVVALLSANASTPLDPAAIALFDRMLSGWPASAMFPVLGLFRLVALRPEVTKFYESRNNDQGQSVVIDYLVRCLPLESKDKSQEAAPISAQLMALCTLSNLFASSTFGLKLVKDPRVLQKALASVKSEDKAIRTVGSALLYNVALAVPKDEESDAVIESLGPIGEAVQKETDAEICHRLLLSLGQLAFCNSGLTLLLGMTFNAAAITARFNSGSELDRKIAAAAKDIQTLVAFEQSNS